MQAEQIERLLKRSLENIGHKTSYILLDDFRKILQHRDLPFSKLKEIGQLTFNEVQLLYHRIWFSNNFKQFTTETFAEYLHLSKSKKKKELMKRFVSEQERRRIMH